MEICLEAAILQGNIEVIKYIIEEKKFQASNKIYRLAVKQGKIELLEYLREH